MIVRLSTLWPELRDKYDLEDGDPDWRMIDRTWLRGVPVDWETAQQWVKLGLPPLDPAADASVWVLYRTATQPWVDRVNAGRLTHREIVPTLALARAACEQLSAAATLAALLRLAERQ